MARRIGSHRSTTAWCATRRCSRRRAWSRPATSRVGRTRMFDGEVARLEHWTNASEQAVAAARRLLHGDAPGAEAYAPVPFVWSDQYDRKIQTAGQFRGDDEMEVVHGSLEERRFTALFGRNGRLVGVLGFSMAAKVMQYRRLIQERVPFDDALAHAHAAFVTSLLVTNDFPPKIGGIQSYLHELWRRLPRARRPCSRRATRVTWTGTRRSRSRVVRSRHSVFLPIARIDRRHRRTRARRRRRRRVRRPVAAAGRARASPARRALRRRRARCRGHGAEPGAGRARGRSPRAPRGGRCGGSGGVPGARRPSGPQARRCGASSCRPASTSTASCPSTATGARRHAPASGSIRACRSWWA